MISSTTRLAASNMLRQASLRSSASASASRASLRRAPIRRQAQAPISRRYASSESSAPAPASSPKSGGSSDALYAITSLVVFGSLFIYLTSPTGKGQAKGHVPTPAKNDGEFPTDEETLQNLRKTEDHSDSHLEGNKFLAGIAHAPDSDGAPTQKKTKEGSVKADNTTFQFGVAAAKDGNHISDPKSVVAAAAAARQEKANQASEKKETKAVEEAGEANKQAEESEEESKEE